MRSLRILFISIALLAVANITLAGCPLQGEYTSAEGIMLEGRASESWPGGAAGELGNTVLASSWDDLNLGSQWQLNCIEICADPVLMEDTVDVDGNGYRTYLTQYCGGDFQLIGTGYPWYDGDAIYASSVVEANITLTVTYSAFVPIFHLSEMYMLGDVLDCTGVCIELTATNIIQMGEGIGTDFPVDYPLPHAPGTCTADDTLLGTWSDVGDVTMLISSCTVPTQDVDWGDVKSLFR